MEIELINTGSELLLGRILNSHQQWLCRQLADHGFFVTRQTAVADAAEPIHSAVTESLHRAQIVITTGGLGPTSDDRTRDWIAELLGLELHEDGVVAERIRSFFAGRAKPMPAQCLVQAQVPRGADVLQNNHGTAPGLIIRTTGAGGKIAPGRVLIMLPGPPRELRPMFLAQVLPWLQAHFPPVGFACRTIRTTGLGESRLEELIAPHLTGLVERQLEVGYCARVGEVDVRFVARGDVARQLVGEAEELLRRLAGEYVWGEQDDLLEEVLVRRLAGAGKTLALAESCTGGFLAHRLTNVPGASAVLKASLVTYANEAKAEFLGVSPEIFATDGAVSEACVRSMAEGARERCRTDYALAVTGIAGPSGGTAGKPVGTVFIGLAMAGETTVQRQLNAFDRETFKYVTAQQAFELLRRRLMADHPPTV